MPTRASAPRRAIPKPMSDGQFDRVVTQGARFAILLIGAFAIIVALALGKVILAPISLAIVVGLMFGPVADAMERHRVPAGLSAAVVVVLFIGILSVAALLFAHPLSEWIARGPALWDKLRNLLVGLKAPLEALSAIQDQIRALIGAGAALTVKVQDGGPVQDVALMAPSIFADILLFLAGLYFFLATRHQIRLSVLSLCFSRRARWRTAHVFRDVELKISRFLLSATAINLGVGVATALATWALGLPSPVLWGAMAAVMNFIPYVGQTVMFVVLFTVGLGTQSSPAGILLPVAAYGAINLTADQIVFPQLVGRALTLNPFIILVSIAFWLWTWGPIGGFVAVPSLLILQSLIFNVFPATQEVPRTVRRKLAAKEAGDSAEATTLPAPRKPAARKAAAAPTP